MTIAGVSIILILGICNLYLVLFQAASGLRIIKPKIGVHKKTGLALVVSSPSSTPCWPPGRLMSCRLSRSLRLAAIVGSAAFLCLIAGLAGCGNKRAALAGAVGREERIEAVLTHAVSGGEPGVAVLSLKRAGRFRARLRGRGASNRPPHRRPDEFPAGFGFEAIHGRGRHAACPGRAP